ncbi:MAG: tRNA lysidine(34) synthetase TilS [Candidatus Omnitrophota bacterium]|jgi:tRNA(Ile)-lysidine synthase
MAADKLIERVLKTTKNYDMLKPGDTVLVAVSGGPDSVFLLHTLNSLKRKLGIKRLIVCNMDHGLRGKESRDDSLFTKKIAAELGVDFIHKKVDLKSAAKGKLSTEELAREARYSFFSEAAKKTGANVLATGHTLDDQAETILMRLVKGSALKGIVGILPVRESEGLRIIRPILEIEKQVIKDYLDNKGISYRIDHTNLEPIYFRNIVRNEIIPFLEKYNVRFKRVLFNLAEHLREDFEFIEEERLKAQRFITGKDGGAVEIRLKDLVIQPKALQKEILRDSLDRIGGEVKRLTFRHWKEMENFIKVKRTGDRLDLPGGIRITRSADRLTFHKI